VLKTLDGMPPGPYTNHANDWRLQKLLVQNFKEISTTSRR